MDASHVEQIIANVVLLLKEERLRANISHQKLADLAGINRSSVSLIEAGKRSPTLAICLRISGALEVDFAELLQRAQQLAAKSQV